MDSGIGKVLWWGWFDSSPNSTTYNGQSGFMCLFLFLFYFCFLNVDDFLYTSLISFLKMNKTCLINLPNQCQ